MPKIVVADRISERGLALLRETGWPIATPGAAELARELSDSAGLIVRSATRVSADLLEKAPALRVVGRAGVGVDNIDVEAATRRGVLVMNTPGGNAVSVAEHTIALLLALARSVPQLAAATRAGFRVLSASTNRRVPWGSACHPAGTRSYTSRVESPTRGFTRTSAYPPAAGNRCIRSPRPVASAGPPARKNGTSMPSSTASSARRALRVCMESTISRRVRPVCTS